MTKEQYTANSPNEQQTNSSEDTVSTSLTAAPRIGPYRSLSAKRPRDPSHRKSVSFNDVPIVHEVPLHDAMRNSNCDTYRSWTYTDATSPTSVIPSYYTSQIFSPFNSSNAAAQKLHANRLSSTLYSTALTFSSPSTTATTATVTPNRIPDWAIRTKTPKSTSTTDDSLTTNEHTNNPSVIVVHTSDEKNNKDLTVKPSVVSPYSTSHTAHFQQQSPPVPIPPPPTITISSFANNHENGDEKKHPYRSALIPDTEHYRSLPFTYGPLSDSTATYTSMLSTQLIQSNHPSNEQLTTGYTRMARARSATLPVTVTHSPSRINDTVSITPFRTTLTTALSPNGSMASTRTVLRPTTIAFQCSQPATTPSTTTITSNANTNSATMHTSMSSNNMNMTNLSPTSTLTTATTNTTNTVKPPTLPPRYGSTAASAAHSRFIFSPNRPFNTSTLTSSAIKYAFAHPSMDSTLSSTNPSHTAMPRPPPTAYPRSRSAHVLSTRRTAASPMAMLDGQTSGGTTTTSATNASTNLYATTKRNPNVRQTYGSYYMHRVLLPTTIN